MLEQAIVSILVVQIASLILIQAAIWTLYHKKELGSDCQDCKTRDREISRLKGITANSAKSDAGFGSTPEEAVQELREPTEQQESNQQ